MPYRPSIAHALNSFCIQDRPYLLYTVAATHNILTVNLHYTPALLTHGLAHSPVHTTYKHKA